MKLEHFNEVVEWWGNRQVIEVEGFDKAKSFTLKKFPTVNTTSIYVAFLTKKRKSFRLMN